MDRIIEVKGNGGYLSTDKRKAGNQHEANSTKLRITFDPSWDGYAKTVTFWDAKGQHPVKRTLTADLLENLDENTRVYLCPIPGEALAENGMMTFTIDGYVNGVRQRTVGAELEVAKSPYEENAGEPADPTPTQAEQLQAEIESLLGDIRVDMVRAEEAAVAADNARIEAERARDASLEIAGGEHVTQADLAGKANLKHASQHKAGGADPLTAADVGAVPMLATYYTTASAKSADDLTVPYAVIPLGSSVNRELYDICRSNFAYVYTGFYLAATVTDRRMQIGVSYNVAVPRFAIRIYGNNGWTPWREIIGTDYAVNKAGDIMTGTLNVAIAGGNAVIVSDPVCAYIQTFKDGDWGRRRTLLIKNLDASADMESAVAIATQDGDSWKEYALIHQKNLHLITPAAIGAARIETGSYVGTGKAGKDHPNSLTFGFEPKVVLISGPDVIGNLLYTKGQQYAPVNANSFTRNNFLTLSGNTLSWYNTSSEASSDGLTDTMCQLNRLGETYTYVAFG